MRMNFFKLTNPIKNYSWGSKSSIQALFDIENPTQEPQAEIWMGAHSNGCSTVKVGDEFISLSDFISADKERVLAKDTMQQFGELPYLFKVLAADEALSIQVHPSKTHAEEGYAGEEALGIKRNAPVRNYRDDNHKPELVYALTSFQAMNGFRPFDEIITLFDKVCAVVEIPVVKRLVDTFRTQLSSKGLEAFFSGILSLAGEDKEQSLKALQEYASKQQQPHIENDINALVVELTKSYSSDIGLFAPLMLNVITLKPYEAMYLDARTPHAYLKGTGLEIMANSDNVLRAGLTPKHIDVKELTRCTLFEENPYESLILDPIAQGNKLHFPVPVQDFKFDCFNDIKAEVVIVNSAEIVFAIDSDTLLEHISGESLTLKKGESVFIPAYAKEYRLTSKGRVARAYN